MLAFSRLLLIVGAGLAASATAVLADVEKYSDKSCPEGNCLFWWPKLPPLAGWDRDDTASLQFHANALAPEGTTFLKADTVIYARAAYKPLAPAVKTLDQFIVQDKAAAKQDQPGVVITDLPVLRTGDGIALKSVTYFPAAGAQGNWDRVSYGEEGEYYLIFTISARSKPLFDAKIKDYERLIASYKAKL